MEERIIDDEYARGIRLKKTKDGYVDVTDELAEEERKAAKDEAAEDSGELRETPEEDAEAAGETEEALIVEGLEKTLESLSEEEGTEEVTFEFPELEEDDEDLVNLTPEEAIALRKKKEAEEAQRKAGTEIRKSFESGGRRFGGGGGLLAFQDVRFFRPRRADGRLSRNGIREP